jgi:aspartate aminotransferase/aminotransferase
MDLKDRLARRALEIEASGIRKVFDLAATLKEPVDLSIGQPDFDVPEPVKEAAYAAIRAGFNRYTPSGGIAELKRAVLDRFEKTHGVRPEDALITAGGSGVLTLALLALVNPGDEVLIPDPFFVSYKHLTTMAGGTVAYYDTYPEFRVDVGAVEKLITPKTKVLLVMSPGNPTGACLDEATKKSLAALARRKGLLLISDEIYELFTYAGGTGKSFAAYYPEGTLVASGLSKTSAMTGWRLGWGLGPKWLIEEMTKLQQFTFVCAPSFAQRAALASFGVDLSGTIRAYRGKRDRLVSGLRAAGYEVVEPGGAFYIFLKVPARYPNGQAFVEEAIRRNLLCVPGHVFSRRDTHVRLSFAASDARLGAGLEILKELSH